MTLTRVELSGIDGATGSIATASINNIKNSASASNNLVLNSDGTTTLTPSNIIKSGTTVASTSGTAIDFTGIPSWVKRITVMFSGVSTNGGSPVLIQLGDSGGVEISGYTCTSGYTGPGTGSIGSTTGFVWMQNNAASVSDGHAIITKISGNNWVYSSVVGRTNDNYIMMGGGSKTLSDTLDRVRLTSTNGTDTFDAGSINILYEG